MAELRSRRHFDVQWNENNDLVLYERVEAWKEATNGREYDRQHGTSQPVITVTPRQAAKVIKELVDALTYMATDPDEFR